MSERIGIFGGTFNPPHVGHVLAAETFSAAINPDKFYIIPDFLPPHKEYDGGVTPKQRLDMCSLAFDHVNNVVISDIEIARGGKSYTYETLLELSAPDLELYFLCGTDMFLTMDSWRNPETIFKLAKICYVRREMKTIPDNLLRERAEYYRNTYGAEILFIDGAVVEISSSQMRSSLKARRDLDFLPRDVLQYIEAEGLYL